MKMLLDVRIPHERFNAAVRAGTVGATLEKILATARPESVYFTNFDGGRAVLLVVDVESPSHVPALAEPWFLSFDADCHFRIVMSPDDLAAASLDAIGKTWS